MCSHQFVYHHIPIHIPLVTSFSQEKTWSKQQTPCELRARRLPRKGAMPMLSILAPAASHASMTNSWFISLTFLWIYDVYIYIYVYMYVYIYICIYVCIYICPRNHGWSGPLTCNLLLGIFAYMTWWCLVQMLVNIPSHVQCPKARQTVLQY